MTDSRTDKAMASAKRMSIHNVERAINEALLIWGDDDPVVRATLLACRRDLRLHLEGATT